MQHYMVLSLTHRAVTAAESLINQFWHKESFWLSSSFKKDIIFKKEHELLDKFESYDKYSVDCRYMSLRPLQRSVFPFDSNWCHSKYRLVTSNGFLLITIISFLY